MKRIFKDTKIYLAGLILLISGTSKAREWTEFYTNTRSLGMGGVNVALTSDETTLFRNPAALGSFRGTYATLIDPEIEASADFSEKFITSGVLGAVKVSKAKELLDGNREQFYRAKVQITPSIVTRYFGIGLIYKDEISAIMNSAGTEMDTIYHSDMGLVIGSNYSFLSGIIKFGAGARVFNRIEVDNANLSTSGSLENSAIASEGTALAFDGSLLVQLPVAALPSFGVVVRDIGNTKFDKKDGLRLSSTTQPKDVKQTIDAGMSIAPIFDNNMRGLISLEYRDLADAHDENWTQKRLHAGVELNWRDMFFFRGGLNQNYWTAGIEIASERWSWMMSTYGEEVGIKSTPKEDRRYSTKFSVRF